MACPVCSSAVEATSGPGRPRVYCGDTCRRAAEFRIRRLAVRIDHNELALRDAQSPGGYWPDDSREERIRELRRWLKLDRAEFHVLLGGNSPETIKNNQKPGHCDHA